jgi:alkyldihydroxyacetonephosphate synthase
VTGPIRGAGPRSKALERDLAALLGPGAASCAPADLWAMSRDCWPRSLLWTKAGVAPHPPDAVVWPASTDEVVRVVRYAAERRIAVVPFGAGSGVCRSRAGLRST